VEIDHLGSSRQRAVCRFHGQNTIALDHHGRVLQRGVAGAIDHPNMSERGHLRIHHGGSEK
jgi:hypothetical protein